MTLVAPVANLASHIIQLFASVGFIVLHVVHRRDSLRHCPYFYEVIVKSRKNENQSLIFKNVRLTSRLYQRCFIVCLNYF
ncbi:unnamed protein product [Schistosoma margrebowiei]|uniref:Uncharacterized protein n=1 Tax=Schistosoma margrebowiei TaxID=48269 RepID=A0A183NAY7_9TREM|nr:unnamed protein product [Schistosoma margrebowiei]